MRILKLQKGQAFPKSDYIFERKKDFLRLVPYLRKKIEGEWSIILIDFKYSEVEEIIALRLPEYTNISVYVASDIRDKLYLKYPKLVDQVKSRFELYMDYMATVKATFSKRAVDEIYSRNSGNLEEIKITVENVIKMAGNKEVIDVIDVDKVIEKKDVVYANEVVLSYLLYNNELVPKKGSMLSKYKYTNRVELRDKYLGILDRSTAFYACRKYIKHLYDQKVNSLNARDYKDVEIIDIVDYYELAHAWLTFKLSKPSQFEICLMNIERRKYNDSIFKNTILGIDT